MSSQTPENQEDTRCLTSQIMYNDFERPKVYLYYNFYMYGRRVKEGKSRIDIVESKDKDWQKELWFGAGNQKTYHVSIRRLFFMIV